MDIIQHNKFLNLLYCFHKEKEAPVRLELTTFRLTVERSNQLSYGAI